MSRTLKSRLFVGAMLVCLGISFGTLAWLLGSTLIDGIPALSKQLFTDPPSTLPEEAGARPAILATIYLAILLLLMAVPIGVLTAMGATRRGVMQVFLTCGLAIVLCGAAVGTVTGCLSALYLDAVNRWLRAAFEIDLFPTRIYNLERVPYDLDPLWIAQVIVTALVVGLVVAGLPAWRAARHDPLESLRIE